MERLFRKVVFSNKNLISFECPVRLITYLGFLRNILCLKKNYFHDRYRRVLREKLNFPFFKFKLNQFFILMSIINTKFFFGRKHLNNIFSINPFLRMPYKVQLDLYPSKWRSLKKNTINVYGFRHNYME